MHSVQLTPERLSQLVDVYSYENGGSICQLMKVFEKAKGEEVLLQGEEELLRDFEEYVSKRAEDRGVYAKPDEYERCEVQGLTSHDTVVFASVLESMHCILLGTQSGVVSLVSLDTFTVAHPVGDSLFPQACELIQSPTATCLVLATTFSTVHVYELFLNKLKLRKVFFSLVPIHTLCYHPHCDRIFTGARDGVLTSFSPAILKGRTTSPTALSAEPHTKLKITSSSITALHATERLLAVASRSGDLILYDTARECITATVSTDNGIRALVMNTCNPCFVTIGHATTNPTIWAVHYPKHSHSLGLSTMQGAILVDLVSFPNTPEIVTMDTKGDMKIWCLVTLSVRHVLTSNKAMKPNPTCLVYIPSKCQVVGFGKSVTSWRATYSNKNTAHYEAVRGVEWLNESIVTYTAAEVKEWNTEFKQVAVPLVPLVKGKITCSTRHLRNAVLGTSVGEVVFLSVLQVLHICIPRVDAISRMAYCSVGGRRVVVGYETGWAVVLTDKHEKVKRVQWEVNLFETEISAISVVPARTVVAFSTQMGDILVTDILLKAITGRFSAGHTEVNDLVWVCEDVIGVATAKGKVQLWCTMENTDEYGVLCERKLTNPDYQHKKGVVKGMLETGENVKLSLRRPSGLQLRYSEELSFLIAADDQGWVTMYDCQVVAQKYRCSGFTKPLHFMALPVVNRWQAHCDEMSTFVVTQHHIITAGLLDNQVLVWDYKGNELCSLSSKQDGQRSIGAWVKASREDFSIPEAIVHTTNVSSLPKGKSLAFIRRQWCDSSDDVATLVSPSPQSLQSPPQKSKRVSLDNFPQSIPFSECSLRGTSWDHITPREPVPPPLVSPKVCTPRKERLISFAKKQNVNLSGVITQKQLKMPKITKHTVVEEMDSFKHKTSLLMDIYYKHRGVRARRKWERATMEVNKKDMLENPVELFEAQRAQALKEGTLDQRSWSMVLKDVMRSSTKASQKPSVSPRFFPSPKRFISPRNKSGKVESDDISALEADMQERFAPALYLGERNADTSSTPCTPDEVFYYRERPYTDYLGSL